MRRPHFQTLAYAFVGLALSAGCGTTQRMPRPPSTLPTSGHAIIRVQRHTGQLGSGRTVTVLDNGKVVGEIGTGGELTWERSAGPMTLSLAPSWMAVKETNPPVAVTVEAGKVYEYFVVLGRDHYFVLADEMWPGERMHRQ